MVEGLLVCDLFEVFVVPPPATPSELSLIHALALALLFGLTVDLAVAGWWSWWCFGTREAGQVGR